MSKLDSFLANAIQSHQKQLSSHLGDRTMYVGASDIAGCPRKAALGKQVPANHDIKTLLRFTRGHVAQSMYAEFFRTGGVNFEEEVEVRHPDCPEILCHIDFLFYANRENKRLHVVEMKSTNGIPEEPYSSWVDQLHVQMGLLKLNLADDVEIGGSVLVVDLNAGEYREFNSYKPNALVFDHLIQKGEHILAAMRGECEPRTEANFLCGYCQFRTGCSEHLTGSPAILPQEILQAGKAYLELNSQKKQIESQLNILKDNLLSYTGGSFKSITDEFSIVATTVSESLTVDGKKLKADFPDIYEQVTKPKSGFVKLEVKLLAE